MTRRRTLAAAVVLVSMIFTGCVSYRADVIPPRGLLFTNFRVPLTSDFDSTATDNLLHVSDGQTHYFWDFLLTGQQFAWGEADIREIARDGGIDEIAFAEYEYMEIIGVYAQFTVHIFGE